MARALRSHWRTGLPSSISHDAHRLGGWTLPTAVSITAAATRLHGVSIVPETGEEQARLENHYQHHLSERVEEETEAHIATLRTALGAHLRGDERPHAVAATTLVGPDLARRVAATIFATEDKDGLVDLNALESLQPGVYKHGDLVLFAHPFFRRSLSRWNNLNAGLLSDLEAMQGAKDSTVRVRLDPDMVGLAASVTRALEFDYWYGPKFDDDLKSIAPGVTRHEANERERHFFGISRTEFWWQRRDSQHILEAEEVRDLPTLGAGATAFGCRYVHSIVDEQTGRVFHLDGAIRSYDEAALVERLDASIAEAGRKTQYTKIWRADGNIPVSRWKELVHDHFRDNPLVREYLSPEPAPRATDPAAVRPSDSPRARMVPHATDAGGGASFLVSFHDLEPVANGKRELRPLERITAFGIERDVIDADVVELRKALARRGEDVHVPPDAVRIAFEDRYLTLPLVRHDVAASVGATVDALGDLLDGWARAQSEDRAMAFSVEAPIDHVDVRCSIYGHAQDLRYALQALRALFGSQTLDEVVGWVDTCAAELRQQFHGSGHDPSTFDAMMTPHETFRVTRTQIAPDDLKLQEEQGTLKHQLRLPADDSDLVAAVRSGQLSPALAWVIDESECSRCSAPYPTCSCSKVLDAEVAQNCKKARVAYAFWTDRPA